MSYEKNPDGTYVDLEFTSFPAQIDSWQNNENVSSELLSDVNDYKKAIQNGNYALAQSILEANPKIKNTIIDATDINELKHSTMALERMFKEDIELYIESFTNKASDFSAKAATSANNAALSESNSKEIQKDLTARYDNIQTTLDTANRLSTEAKDSAKRAEESVNYVQQHVGGYYNSYTFEISPGN